VTHFLPFKKGALVFADRPVLAALTLAVLCVAGCGNRYSTETIIGGRPVVYQSTTEKAELRKVINQDVATFAVGQFQFTVDRTQVTWGQGQSLALPNNWKRVDFIDKGDHVAVHVDRRAYGEIRPAA
jgi:hypothetical protein